MDGDLGGYAFGDNALSYADVSSDQLDGDYNIFYAYVFGSSDDGYVEVYNRFDGSVLDCDIL